MWCYAWVMMSCTSLQSVSQFSEQALASTGEFDRSAPTFQHLCEEKNMMEALRMSQVQRNYQGGCDLALKADTVVNKMQQAVNNYLSGLYLLTSNQRLKYSLDPIAEALQTNTQLGVKEEVVSAYQQVLELLLRSSSEAYRRKKTAWYIEQAQAPLAKILDQLIFIMDTSLREAVEQQREMLYLQTKELSEGAASILEKRNLILSYAQQLKEYEHQCQRLDTYVAILHQIKAGHGDLFEKRQHLNKEESLETLVYYTGRLQQLQRDFEKIK